MEGTFVCTDCIISPSSFCLHWHVSSTSSAPTSTPGTDVITNDTALTSLTKGSPTCRASIAPRPSLRRHRQRSDRARAPSTPATRTSQRNARRSISSTSQRAASSVAPPPRRQVQQILTKGVLHVSALTRRLSVVSPIARSLVPLAPLAPGPRRGTLRRRGRRLRPMYWSRD